MENKISQPKESVETSKKVSVKYKEPIPKLPKGSVLLSKSLSTTIEEIENGYLICKTTEFNYQKPDRDYSDWKSFTQKYYSQTNPIKVDKALADLMPEDAG